jgi:hypothetical protein
MTVDRSPLSLTQAGNFDSVGGGQVQVAHDARRTRAARLRVSWRPLAAAMNRLSPALMRASMAVFPLRGGYVMQGDALAAQPRAVRRAGIPSPPTCHAWTGDGHPLGIAEPAVTQSTRVPATRCRACSAGLPGRSV